MATRHVEVRLVDVGRHRPPFVFRWHDGWCPELVCDIEPAAGLVGVGPASRMGIRREQDFEAQDVAAVG